MSSTAPGKTVFFISPHLDDVALSCPKAISALKRQGFEIKVITVFSQSTHPKIAGPRAWERVPYEQRKSEDLAANKIFGAQSIHLDFLDAPYRHRKYNSFNKLFSRSPAQDTETVNQVARRLETLVNEHNPLKIFSPLGIGWHIDHLITFAAVKALKESIANKKEIEFYHYEDRPYVFVTGSRRIRFAELNTFPATESSWQVIKRIVAAPLQAWRWSFSPMVRRTQPHFFSTLWGFLLNLKRNIKALPKKAKHAALTLQLEGSEDELNFAYEVAKAFPSQFPYLYGNDESFKRSTLIYAHSLSPNASYAERIWIL